MRHNHLTRDIKEQGKCPACDEYHAMEELCVCGHPRRQHDKVDTEIVYGWVGECLNTDNHLCPCLGFTEPDDEVQEHGP